MSLCDTLAFPVCGTRSRIRIVVNLYVLTRTETSEEIPIRRLTKLHNQSVARNKKGFNNSVS